MEARASHPPSFPTQFEVTNGSISGKDLSFTFSDCTYTAKVVGGGENLEERRCMKYSTSAPPFLNALISKATR